MEVVLSAQQTEELSRLYTAMEAAYDQAASSMNLSCSDCDDNCCDSLFHHHTRCEWAYLWQGLRALPQSSLSGAQCRAGEYVAGLAELGPERRRLLPCPLLENGRCLLYSHRLMICRLHGVPSQMVRPDGRRLHFPGCFRSQQLCEKTPTLQRHAVDRTPLLQRLAKIELELNRNLPTNMVRPRMTIAEMIIAGPPTIP